MSLTVPPELVRQAEQGDVADEAFIACIRESLPYAWNLIAELADRLRAGGEMADNQVPPPDESARGQLLRVLASDAMRGALERHHGVRLAFQNCHRVAVFAPGAESARETFTSPRAQLLNQSPELVDC